MSLVVAKEESAEEAAHLEAEAAEVEVAAAVEAEAEAAVEAEAALEAAEVTSATVVAGRLKASFNPKQLAA